MSSKQTLQKKKVDEYKLLKEREEEERRVEELFREQIEVEERKRQASTLLPMFRGRVRLLSFR